MRDWGLLIVFMLICQNCGDLSETLTDYGRHKKLMQQCGGE